MARPAPTPDRLPNVAVYTRVSTEEQTKGEHYSLDTQRAACLEKLDRVYGKGLYVPVFFGDEGYPGRYGLYDPAEPKKKHRPGLTAMHQAFVRGELDVICVYRMSRFWRKAAAGDFVREQFIPNGLKRLISCTENIDIETANGRLQLNINAALGAFEAEQLGEWISDARVKRARDGYPNGVPYGWRSNRYDPDRATRRPGVIPMPGQAEIVQEIARRYVAGQSVRAITAWLNATGVATSRKSERWVMSTVRRILVNPVHAGLVRATDENGDKYLVQGAHYEQRLYDPEVHHTICARIERSGGEGGKRGGSPKHLLSGLLRCGHCGCIMNGRMQTSAPNRQYRCSCSTKDTERNCGRNTERAVLVEQVVLDAVAQIVTRADVVECARKQLEVQLAAEHSSVSEEMAALEKRLEGLWEVYRYWSNQVATGDCEQDEFAFHRDDFRRQKTEVETRLAEVKARQVDDATRAAVLARAQTYVTDFDASWDAMSLEERREAVHSVVQSITMCRREDNATEVRLTLYGFPEIARIIPRERPADRPTSGPESLTGAQMAILYLKSQGLTYEEIAKRRGVKPRTVREAISVCRRLLGVKSTKVMWEMVRERAEGILPALPTDRTACRRHKPERDKPLLTEAQARLLSHMATGLSVKSAADAIGISPNTAYVHLQNARQRVGSASNEELVKRTRDLGLLEVT